MIICRSEETKGAFGDTFTTYVLTSTNHEKIVRATENRGFKNGKVIPAKGFRARNECNGSSFEKDEYHQILETLKSRGW